MTQQTLKPRQIRREFWYKGVGDRLLILHLMAKIKELDYWHDVEDYDRNEDGYTEGYEDASYRIQRPIIMGILRGIVGNHDKDLLVLRDLEENWSDVYQPLLHSLSEAADDHMKAWFDQFVKIQQSENEANR
jgi:hypothetical protein